MNTAPGRVVLLIAILSVFVIASLAPGGHASASSSAVLSTATLDLLIGDDGLVTFYGEDDGEKLEFEWTFPRELKVTRGDSANLDEFEVNRRRGRLKVESDGEGSFFAQIFLSSEIAGTYVLSNRRASIGFSPEDVTVVVGDLRSDGDDDYDHDDDNDDDNNDNNGDDDDDSPTPTPIPTPPASVNITLRVCEGANWEIRRNMVLSDLYLFGDGPCTSTPTLPGPEIRVNEGDTVSIRFINDASNTYHHALIFPGLDVNCAGVVVAPSTDVICELPTDTPGTFYYAAELVEAGELTPDRREIDRGMYGGIVVKSANERFVRPEFDAIRFFDEIPRVVAGGDITFETHTIVTLPGPGHKPPTYITHEFLVNGKTIDSKVDGNNLETVVMHGGVGEDTLMRMICIGSETHALHLHGHIPDATADGRTTNDMGAATTIPTDVVRCPSGDVRNLYVAVRAPGTWVWHCHRETHLLNNLDADYPGGMFTHLEVSGRGEKDD